MKVQVTLIGTLPPVKGLSPYCQELFKSLCQITSVEFIGFRKLYPDFLYPGGTTFVDKDYQVAQAKEAEIRNLLTYYNPFSWLWAGATARGEIIHAQWWSHVLAPVYFFILAIAKLRRKRVVITVHNILPHEKKRLNSFLNRTILRFGDQFIVHSSKNKESLCELYRIAEDRVSIVPHGVLEPVSVKGISQEEGKKQLGIPITKRVVLYFGNIRDYKGLDTLLEAMALVVLEIQEAMLVVAGKPWVGWERFEKIIAKNNLQDHITRKLDFIPPSEVEYYFSASDVVVLPYKYFDSQSGVGALALPFKRPLIVSAVGGLPDFVKDPRAVVRPDDPGELAKAIVTVLQDEKLGNKLSRDSEELISEYAQDIIAQRTVAVYQKSLR